MKKLYGIVLLVALCGSVFAGSQSKAETAASAATDIVFGPHANALNVTFCYASSSDTSTTLGFWARTGSAETVTATPTNGATLIFVDNADSQFAASDRICYVYSDGAEPLSCTISAATTTNITLNTAIGQTGTATDKVYELSENAITINTTTFNPAGGLVFITPKDSPLYIRNDSTTNSSVMATVNWGD